MKNGVTNTLPIEARSNIKLIEISPDNRTLVIVDIGNNMTNNSKIIIKSNF